MRHGAQQSASNSRPTLIEPLTELVIWAGAAILAVNRSAMKVDGKLDGSPVTEADLAADRIIGEGLARLAPQISSLSEERVHLATPPYKDSFFLIDPLDGTKEFVAGRNEFTVNLALVTDGKPLLGIVGAPALGLVWRGLVGRGAERLTRSGSVDQATEPIRTRPCPPPGKPWTVGGQPLAWRCQDRSLYRQPARCRPGEARFGRQIRPGRGGRSRHLSPPRSHLGMGRRGRPCRGHRGRRQGDGFQRGPSCISASGARISSCRNSSPGAIRRRLPDYGASSLLEGRRPARPRHCPRNRWGSAAKVGAVLLAAEQIEPLARHHPEPGITPGGNAPRQIDRVVAAEPGPVDFRMGHKGGAVALVAKTPDGARLGGLVIGQAADGALVGKIGDRVIPLDRETRIAVHDQPLGGRGPGGPIQPGRAEKGRQQRNKGYSGAPAIYFLPLCRHS